MIDDDFFHRADRIVEAAMDVSIADDAVFLDGECGNSTALRNRVNCLLQKEITREVGRSGMGVVDEAMDSKLRRSVALKVLSETNMDARVRRRFRREARASAALNHPSIVAMHDAGEAQEHPPLVMETIDGKSLEADPPTSRLDGLRQQPHFQALIENDIPANDPSNTEKG